MKNTKSFFPTIKIFNDKSSCVILLATPKLGVSVRTDCKSDAPMYLKKYNRGTQKPANEISQKFGHLKPGST